MKRRVMLVAIAVILCSLVVAGGTLAYFTATSRPVNQVSTGKISITLHEQYGEEGENLVPNPQKLISKNVWVENNQDSGAAYVRIQVTKGWYEGRHNDKFLETPLELPVDNIVLKLNPAQWFYHEDEDGNGWYYYRQPLAAGESSGRLFSGFTFMPLSQLTEDQITDAADLQNVTDNDYKGLHAHIDVRAEAVQAVAGAVEHEWQMTCDQNGNLLDPAEQPDGGEAPEEGGEPDDGENPEEGTDPAEPEV